MRDFVVVLQHLLVDPQDSPLRTEAGKALSALVRSRGDEFPDKFPDIQQLLTIMGAADDAYSKEYRVVTAEMLAKICAKSSTAEVQSNALSTVRTYTVQGMAYNTCLSSPSHLHVMQLLILFFSLFPLHAGT
jgi:hypothetical protein